MSYYEQLALSGLSDCLIPQYEGEYTPELNKPVPENADVAKYMYDQCRFAPTEFKSAVDRYRASCFVIQTNTPIAVIRSGALAMFRVVDCLGVVVTSTALDGMPLMTAFHRSVDRGYNIDDIKMALTTHRGTSKLSFAIAGADLDPTILALQGSPILKNDVDCYKTMAQELIGPDISFGSCCSFLAITKESKRKRGMFTSIDIFVDTNQPHRILTRPQERNSEVILRRMGSQDR